MTISLPKLNIILSSFTYFKAYYDKDRLLRFICVFFSKYLLEKALMRTHIMVKVYLNLSIRY